jgi:copper chaperone NosL
LLNFDAFSYPDTGAWIAIGVVAVLAAVWLIEWRRNRRVASISANRRLSAVSFLVVPLIFFTACNPVPEKINIGKDACSECKMSISDSRFGGEIVTKKGKVYKFDDVHCIASFLNKRAVELSDIHQTLFVDYNEPHNFIEVKKAEFVISSSFKSPMAGNAAAFATKEAAGKKSAELDGSKLTNWSTLYNILIK